jgi:hypothetical protein
LSLVARRVVKRMCHRVEVAAVEQLMPVLGELVDF